jgi:hypothetical protein
MPFAIRVENLSKRYRIRHAAERLPYRTLRDDLVRAATAPVRWLLRKRSLPSPHRTRNRFGRPMLTD